MAELCLPIMAASVLNGNTSKIIDALYKRYSVMIEILKCLGATVERIEKLYI